MFINEGEIMLSAIAVVGVASLVLRRKSRECSSWPTWFLVPIALLFALPMGVLIVDPLRPFCFTVLMIVICRWLVALILRERSYGWAFYMVLLILAEVLIYPAANWYAGQP